MVGLDARATMDMDATIKGADVTLEAVEKIIADIVSVPLEDGVIFRIRQISGIMDEADYSGVRVSMETEFDRVRTPLKIDISTGDVITPKEIKYRFKLILEERSIDIWAYNLETVMAEKLETLISRSVTNTRMRDFYDIHILLRLYGNTLDTNILGEALQATARKRGTEYHLKDAQEILDEVQNDSVMQKLWGSYRKKFSYAADISWETVMESATELYHMSKGYGMKQYQKC